MLYYFTTPALSAVLKDDERTTTVFSKYVTAYVGLCPLCLLSLVDFVNDLAVALAKDGSRSEVASFAS